MSPGVGSSAVAASPDERLGLLFEELAELTGQRNAIDGRIVEIVAEIDGDELWGGTGCRSVEALVAWKTGCSPRNAETVTAIADRIRGFPRCVAALREGRLSLDQVGVIVERGGEGSDDHYIELAENATVAQLRTAIKLEPQPAPTSRPEPRPGISKSAKGELTCWTITLPTIASAKFEAALASQHDGLIAEWRRDHAETDGPLDDELDVGERADTDGDAPGVRPPMPKRVDAFLALVDAGWDTDVARRPHGQRTTVVVHVDVRDKVGSLHLGPLLTAAERRYLGCDATCEVWFERHGQVIGSGAAPARSVGGCVARSNTATRRARCPGVAPAAGCTPITSGIGRTVGKPSSTIWCWCVRGITANTIVGPSPSPDPPRPSPSPTVPGAHCTPARWRGHPAHPHRMSRLIAVRPGNAQTGGGTTPTNRDRRRPTESLCGP